jgi:serine/threonine protein kinase
VIDAKNAGSGMAEWACAAVTDWAMMTGNDHTVEIEGRVVSHYRVGVIHSADDTHLKRKVVLKFLAPEPTRDDEARERFVQEAEAASALDHPNICAIYDVDPTDDGRLFIAMAYYDGETVKARLTRGRKPYFAKLGTPPEHKRHVVLNGGHYIVGQQ